MPGISVPPWPSITSAPSRAIRAPESRATAEILLPSTFTSPGTDGTPVPSKMRTLLKMTDDT